MSDDVWSSLKYFRKKSTQDNWGQPDKMSPLLLLKLDRFREFINSPLIVTSGYRANDPGQHGKGLAVDVIAPGWGKPFFDLYLAAERFGFKGIGIYQGWQYKGNAINGLHLDERDTEGKPGARWMGLGNSRDKNIYYTFNLENLFKLGFIPQKTVKTSSLI